MPGLASADPHTHPTLSISRMNGRPRSNAIVSPVRNMEHINSTEHSRIDQRHNFIHQKDLPPHFDLRTAEESLSVYCKPVELYNIIQRRALRNPFFLQRCLSYNIEAAHERRIKLTISIFKVLATLGEVRSSTSKLNGKSSDPSNDLQEQPFQSVIVMLTSPIATPGTGYASFRLNQTRVLKATSANSSSGENIGQAAVTFLLPEARKLLLNAKRDGAVIIFITCVDLNPLCNGKGTQIDSSVNCNGPVLWGSISLTTFCQNWLNHSSRGASISGTYGERLERTVQLDLYPSRLQLEDSADGRCIRFQQTSNGSNGKSMVHLQLCISGEEVGRGIDKVRCSSGSLFTSERISSFPSASQARRLQPGQVIFHYYYLFNQLCKSEVTDEYSCPFCVLCCSSFKGLRCHLNSTHDLFSFEFLATPDYRAVNVTCRNSSLGPEGNAQDIDGLKNFVYWSRSGRPRKLCGLVTASAVSLHFEGQAPVLEKGSHGLHESLSHDPISSADILVSSLEPNNSSCRTSPEPTLAKDDSISVCREQNHVQQISERGNDQAGTIICNSTPSTSAIAEDTELQVKAGSLQEQPRKHERQEDQEHRHSPRIGEHALQSLRKQQSEGVIVEHSKAQTSLVQSHISMSANGVCLAIAAPTLPEECRVQSSVSFQVLPAVPQMENNRKILVERSEARIRSQLQKRQFFHSHRAQPMALEQLISDRDSEDEADDAITDLEDRRMLDDFVDVTQDEKELMHLWNSFVRKQRVLADGHCLWACEVFTKLHANKFAERPALRRCLMLFLTKLWNHHLVDGNAINRCLQIADSFQEKPQQR